MIVHSVNVFKAYPSFLVPILTVWMFYAPAVVYLTCKYPWNAHGMKFNLAVVFLLFFWLSFFILMSCAVVLEMIRQIEAGEPSLSKAVAKALSQDTLKIFPLAFVWAVIWFALSLLEPLLTRKNNGGNIIETLTAQNAAAALANYEGFSLSRAFFEALEKGLRMVMFLIVPAMVWDNLDFTAAIKKGFAVLKAHVGEFGTGYVMTYALAWIVFLPAAIILGLGIGRHGGTGVINFSEPVWVAVIIYMGVAWSFSMYLEQMFMAQLYLWNRNWEASVARATAAHQPVPAFADVARPELLAKTPGLFAASMA